MYPNTRNKWNRGALALAIVLLVAPDAAAQIPPVRFETSPSLVTPQRRFTYGLAVRGGGDVNGDGVDDIIIGNPRGVGTLAGSLLTGRALIVSGAGGSVLFEVSGAAPHSMLGNSVDFLGDLDGDGYDEFLIGIPWDPANGVAGAVRVYDGFSQTVLYTVVGAEPADALGWAVSRIGDIDGDGVPDFVAGAPHLSISSQGYARVYSGATGTLLYDLQDQLPSPNLPPIPGPPASPPGAKGSHFGACVRGLDDLDGDGIPDFAVGAPDYEGEGPSIYGSGRVLGYSGADGLEIFELNTPTPPGAGLGDRFGFSIGRIGTTNVGGPGLVIGAPGTRDPSDVEGAFEHGAVHVYRMAVPGFPWPTRERTYFGTQSGELFGRSVDGLVDIDGDGVDEIVASNDEFWGGVRVISWAKNETLFDFFLPMFPLNIFGKVCDVGDLDGDGTTDLAVASHDRVRVYGLGPVARGRRP